MIYSNRDHMSHLGKKKKKMIFTFLMFIWKIAFPKTRLFAQVCLSEEASKRLALRTMYHEVPGSNAARGGIQFMTVMALHCTELVIIILPLSRYDLNNVKKDIKHQTIIIYLSLSI